jgi:hypothetical protein
MQLGIYIHSKKTIYHTFLLLNRISIHSNDNESPKQKLKLNIALLIQNFSKFVAINTKTIARHKL